MRPMPDLADPHLATCAVLRQCLETLVAALAFQSHMPPETPADLRVVYDPTWAIDSARLLLDQDTTGVAVQRELAVHMGLALLAYEFCDYLEALEMQGLTHPDAIQEGLEQVRRLTVASYGQEAPR